MAVKKYKIEYPNLVWECEVELDEEFALPDTSDKYNMHTTADAIKNMVEFWSEWERRLFYNDGNYIHTFLKQLGKAILYIVLDTNYNVDGVIEEFENMEGWFPMDGSYGIKILSSDSIELDADEFTVSELK